MCYLLGLGSPGVHMNPRCLININGNPGYLSVSKCVFLFTVSTHSDDVELH